MEDKKLAQLISRYEAATTRLIEADRELASFRDDQYVTWELVSWYISIDDKSIAAKTLLFTHYKTFNTESNKTLN